MIGFARVEAIHKYGRLKEKFVPTSFNEVSCEDGGYLNAAIFEVIEASQGTVEPMAPLFATSGNHRLCQLLPPTV